MFVQCPAQWSLDPSLKFLRSAVDRETKQQQCWK